MKNRVSFIAFVLVMLVFGGCGNPDDKNINLFSIEDDKKLGADLAADIASKPAEYPILDETQYAEAYSHINRITNEILNSGEVYYKDEFVWEVKIIHDDNVLNAFCAPGGYIYVYTGLMKYLATENELAGVMGHEIAHADRRHTTDQLTKQYGISILLDLVLGNNQGMVTEIATGLIGLAYGRADESESDEYSVKYLCGTDLAADGAAGFFEKLINDGSSGSTPAFLSTHPNPENRVENIQAHRVDFGCVGSETTGAYQAILNSLP